MTLLTLTNALIASTVQGLILALAVALCLRLLPSIPAAARSLIWTAVFTLILALPFLPTPHATSSHSVAINPIWTIPVAALWLTASLIRATQLILSALALRRLARSATPVPDQPGAPFPLVCLSAQIDRPSVVGFFSRRILLPPSLFASLTPAELHHVLLHETEHLRRRDDWTNLLQKLALVAVPLNPVLLWVERRLCLERELACDDRVLRATGTPKAYATCLTHLAEHSLLRRSLSLALGFLGSIGPVHRQSELSRRVHRILQAPAQAMSPRQTRTATAALLLTLAGGTFTLVHTPQLILFALPVTQSAELSPTPITTGGATFQPATFHVPVSSPKPTLIKAVQPATIKPHPIHRVRRNTPRPSPVRILQADWISPVETPRPQRLVLTAASGDQISYTFVSTVAVATPRGWIIFQL